MPEVRAYLCLGANLGDARAMIAEALARLDANGAHVVARSADYETPPWGKLDQPPFVNVCAEVATDLSPLALLRLCLATEKALGRQRLEKWGPRTIDIDVLLHGDAAIATPELTLPHPHMMQRAFVLIPLLEIAPNLVVDGRPVVQVATALPHDGIRKAARTTDPACLPG